MVGRSLNVICSQLHVSQPQRVGDDGDRTQAHRHARDHGTQQRAEEWVEQTRCDGDAERVVDEGEKRFCRIFRIVARLK